MASSAASNSSVTQNLRRNSNDIGWEFGVLVDPTSLDKIKCILCEKIMSGGVTRLKEHIANKKGNVAPCKKSTIEDQKRVMANLMEPKAKKMEKRKQIQEIRDEVKISSHDDDEVEGEPKAKKPIVIGAMDQFTKKSRQQSIVEVISKEKILNTQQHVAKWVYEAGIPFHAIACDSFVKMVEAIGKYGPGFQPPSQWQLREPLLKKEVEKTKESLKSQEEAWELYGCTLMTDAWTDRKRRSIMNLCVNCIRGTTFLSSKEVSNESHTGQYIFEYVDKCIDEIGSEKVVQIVTDNASNNMAAADLMKEKRPSIFWSSCAAHTIDLVLEGIGKTNKFKGVIEKARAFTIFIYAHHKTLAMMRKFTNQSDIVRPGVTRFATSFLTLQSLLKKKEKLRLLVTSDDWLSCNHVQTTKGKVATGTIMSAAFWSGVTTCLKVFDPLVKILRLVDADLKPSMGFLYGEMLKAKEEIKVVYSNVESNYRPILDIIDSKISGRLDSPLHLFAFLLNPYYLYKDHNIQKDPNISEAVFTCAEKLFPSDIDMQDIVVNRELAKYKNKEGSFGRALALKGCEPYDYDIVDWWETYGTHTPNLQKVAIRIVALTTSSSGCERNWSGFEAVHTKKRNRLDALRLNNLVYVQFNAKLLNRQKRLKKPNVDILCAKEATNAQGWIVDGGDDVDPETGISWKVIGEASGADEVLQSRRSTRHLETRELDEEEFESEEENEENDEGDFDFGSDDDGVMDGYGDEE